MFWDYFSEDAFFWKIFRQWLKKTQNHLSTKSSLPPKNEVLALCWGLKTRVCQILKIFDTSFAKNENVTSRQRCFQNEPKTNWREIMNKFSRVTNKHTRVFIQTSESSLIIFLRKLTTMKLRYCFLRRMLFMVKILKVSHIVFQYLMTAIIGSVAASSGKNGAVL